MNLSENNKIYGLEPGILYGQNERVDELNERALARFSVDTPLQPNLSSRSVPTKYARFPLIDRVKLSNVPIQSYLDHSVSTNFAPIQGQGPFTGYQVGIESDLRNQYFAIQSAPQATYIPSSSSDLYHVPVPTSSRQEVQPFLGLFDNYRMDPMAPIRNADPKIGANTFLNNTRVQLRGGVLS
jgi:hypothetical protein